MSGNININININTNITIKNIIFLTYNQINQLAVITAKPEIMKHISDGKPYTKSQIYDFIKDEKTQVKLPAYKRKYWTYAVLNETDDVIGLMTFYNLNMNKFHIFKPNNSKTKKSNKSAAAKTKKGLKPLAAKTIGFRRILDIPYQGKGIGARMFEIMRNILINCHFVNDKIPVDIISIVNVDNEPSNKLEAKEGKDYIGMYRDGDIERNIWRYRLIK